MTKTQFRAALVLSYALGAVSAVAAFAAEPWLPALLRRHLETERNAEFTATDGMILIVILPFLIANLVSLIALLNFWRRSRELAVAVTVAALMMIPFLGPTVEPGVSTALNFLSSMLYGAVIALAYYSPAARWFQAMAPTPPPPFPMGGETVTRVTG